MLIYASTHGDDTDYPLVESIEEFVTSDDDVPAFNALHDQNCELHMDRRSSASPTYQRQSNYTGQGRSGSDSSTDHCCSKSMGWFSRRSKQGQ